MILAQINHFLLAADCTGQALLPDLYAGLRTATNPDAPCEVQVDSLNKVLILVGNAISILMLIAGIVAVAFIIIGGFMYITSSGEPAGIKKAKDTIVNAVVGLIIALVAVGVVKAITGRF